MSPDDSLMSSKIMISKGYLAALAAAVATLTLCAGCRNQEAPDTTRLVDRIRLATTTSCENSGLLDYLLPRFEAATGIHVDVISVGSGRALRLGENGDVDVLLVHSPEAELAFMESGFGVNRRSVMYNEFVLVGPPDDPAEIRGTSPVTTALSRILSSGATFVSRGDDSGTHAKELSLWDALGSRPEAGEHYLEAGQGMAATLRVADEMHGYCLTDVATYLTYSGDLDLEILVEGDPLLRNPYHVIAINPQRHPHVKYIEAMMFIAWLTSPEGVEQIGSFERQERQLFTPDP